MRRLARLTSVGALVAARSLAAQDVQGARGPCEGRIVSDIVIRTQGPSFGGIFARSGLMSAMVSGVHVTTSPDVVDGRRMTGRQTNSATAASASMRSAIRTPRCAGDSGTSGRR